MAAPTPARGAGPSEPRRWPARAARGRRLSWAAGASWALARALITSWAAKSQPASIGISTLMDAAVRRPSRAKHVYNPPEPSLGARRFRPAGDIQLNLYQRRR